MSLLNSNTASSVINKSTTYFPVSGRVHYSSILWLPFAVCSIVTTTLLAPLTKSIAPPIPLTNLPGMIQLAKSPLEATYNAPKILKSICFPLIMPKLYDEEKNEAPVLIETVYLPAFIKSASTSYSSGNPPNPNIPFSLWRVTVRSGDIRSGQSVGIPIPKFTYMPSLIS